MKKKIAVLLLCLIMVLGAFPEATFAAGRFTDTDAVTLQNTDILGMMGIISDHPEKIFRPNDNLTRSEFCKMAVIAMGNGNLESQYKNSSIFPDVRANHWASGYIGVAAKGPGHFIQGYADGSFGPENIITYAEAITILMRMLGYTDKDSGGLWPDGYISLAKKAGISVAGVAKMGTITRSQAVKLFVDTIGAENSNGIPYYKTMGNAVEKMTIISADGGSGRVKFSNGEEYYMAVPCAISTIVGRKGTAVFDADGKLILFMPDNLVKANAPASAAIIVAQSGSTDGFDVLSGGSKSYSIYKNGEKIETKDIKQYDVATYNAATDTIVLCDSRLNTYYNNCTPSASHPSTITILDGLELNVLSTAQDMLAAYKPGMTLTFYFTADGQIAGATNNASYANMLAAVNEDGEISLICGANLIPVQGISIDSKYNGRIVSIRSFRAGDIQATVQTRESNLSLNFKDGTCDGKKIADNVLIFNNGTLVQKADLPESITYSKIDFYRTDKSGNVDLINIRDTSAGTVCSGIAEVTEGYKDEEEENTLRIISGNNPPLTYPSGRCPYDISNGDYVTGTYRNGSFVFVKKLEKLGQVSKEAFIGTTMVNVKDSTYSVDKDCVYFNIDTKLWMDNRDAAFEYADRMTLYADGNIVRMIVVEAITK